MLMSREMLFSLRRWLLIRTVFLLRGIRHGGWKRLDTGEPRLAVVATTDFRILSLKEAAAP